MSPTLYRMNSRLQTHRRRGVVAVKVAILAALLIGFAALAVDVGIIYNARQELRRSVEASALAGAAMLAKTSHDPEADPGSDPRDYELALSTALAVALENPVTNAGLHVKEEDVEFGWAEPGETAGPYVFTPGTAEVNAVRVTGRRTEDNAEDGPVSLVFAAIFGIRETDMVATATALMQPRDIAIVADMSASHNNDSELRNMHAIDINIAEVWAALPGGADESPELWPGWSPTDDQALGYAWGFFQRNPTGQTHGKGFGEIPTDWESYDPNGDDGLVHLEHTNAPRDWVPTPGSAYAEMQNYLVSSKHYKLGDVSVSGDSLVAPGPGQEPSEIYAILGDHATGSTARLYNWVFRSAVATGFADWYSGIPGGRWQTEGMSPPPFPANGNNLVDPWELVWGASSFNGRSPFEMAFLWFDYTLEYVSSDETSMVEEGNPDFQWKMGPKTFMNYLMEERPRFVDTPELRLTPHQPVRSEKDAVNALAEALQPDYHDLLSLEVYATSVHHEVDLTESVLDVPARLEDMQAAHYDGYTNIGGGIREARNTLLNSENARPNATKIIVLLSDGRATAWEDLTENSPAGVPVPPPNPANTAEKLAIARQYAIDQAQWAGQAGIQVYAVSLGATADLELMELIARLTNGRHYHVEGDTIGEYAAELIRVFEEIAVIRPVTLVQ